MAKLLAIAVAAFFLVGCATAPSCSIGFMFLGPIPLPTAGCDLTATPDDEDDDDGDEDGEPVDRDEKKVELLHV